MLLAEPRTAGPSTVSALAWIDCKGGSFAPAPILYRRHVTADQDAYRVARTCTMETNVTRIGAAVLIFPALLFAVPSCTRQPTPESTEALADVSPLQARVQQPCRGRTAGNVRLSQRAGAAYSVSYQAREDGQVRARLEAAIIARGQPGWEGLGGSRRRLVPPQLPEATGHLSGATIDTLFMRFDPQARVAWVHTRKVPLPDGDNVVLVDRADNVGGPITVVNTLQVEPDFGFPTCGGHAAELVQARTDSIRAALLRSPEVRAFIGS